MKPTKTLLVSAALILGAMGAQAADFVQNGNYLTVQLKQHQNYGPSQIRLQVVSDRIIRVQATAEQGFRNKQSLIIVPQNSKAQYKVEEQGDDLIITTAAMRAVLNEAMFGREMRDSRSNEEMLKEALDVAQQADIIVAAVGESSEMSGECSSRTNLEMPDAQKDLLIALKKTGKPIVLVNFSGRATVMTWEQENFPAILNVWFGGCESGDAICDVLFGDKVPSGKLTATMPKSVGQIPLYYNHLNTGRPLKEGKWFSKFTSNYLDIDNDPLYPFGYGLSYTTFKYGKPTLSSNTMTNNETISVSVDITNTGNYDADEIAQMYIRDLAASVSRPVKELKGFERISIKKGETKTVTFTITPEDLKFYNQELEYKNEPGEFEVMVGPNSKDVQALTFTLK